jgi:O-succinylbenzoic acid--CoA ligase
MLVFNPHQANYPEPLNSFQKEVFDFCQQWNSGKNEFLFQTSGSTGKPKPIHLARKSMIESAMMTQSWLHLKEGDHALLCLPIQYIAGAIILVRALVLKLNIVLIEPSQNPLEGIKKPIKIHLASFVTTQWSTIMESKFHLYSIFSDVKGILIGGSELTSSLELLTQDIQLPIFQTYGMTETASHIAYRLISAKTNFYQCLPEVKIKINANGCLSINSPTTLNKWIDTNDMAELMTPNQFRIMGRSDFMINSGGRKINPAIIEKCSQQFLTEHSLGFKLFACGLPDDFYGQKLVLLIETSNDFHLKLELMDYLKLNLDNWEVPKQLIFLPHFLYTDSGKIDRPNTLTLYVNNLKLS